MRKLIGNPYLWALLALLGLAFALAWIVRRIGFENLVRLQTLDDVSNAITSGKLVWPVPGHMAVSSGFGPRVAPVPGASTSHNGIDIPAPTGTPVVAPEDGTVNAAFSNDKGGNQMTVLHDSGRVTGYAHLSERLVDVGERVTAGQTIAKVGATGNVSGPHLHFTLRASNGGAHIDPAPLFA